MGSVGAQSPTVAGYEKDPQTGIVYSKTVQTIEQPVVRQEMRTQTQVVYTPQVVTETKPENRTVYTPVVENVWEPRLHNRWNPFARPTVAYHNVARTRWEARNEVVNRTQTRTDWIAKQQTRQVPTQVVTMERKQQVNYQPVGTVAPRAIASSSAPASNLDPNTLARLRPLGATDQVNPTSIANAPVGASFGQPFNPPRLAASTVGRLTSDPPRRTMSQGGMRATDLGRPTSFGSALPPASSSTGVATLPMPMLR
ncbi:MAG: hypothetical protein AAF664_09120 [Planctomycetota bacterium]